jgi:Flp pilus assembly protein TadG
VGINLEVISMNTRIELNEGCSLRRCRRAASWRHFFTRDHGSATAELTLLAPLLILMLLFIVFCGRVSETRLRLEDAAHQAARAASLARSVTAAESDAQSTATGALAGDGVTCQSVNVALDTGGLQPGSTVTATVSCTVDLSDLDLLGLPGSTTLSASFASPVDVYRSDPTTTGVGGRNVP